MQSSWHVSSLELRRFCSPRSFKRGHWGRKKSPSRLAKRVLSIFHHWPLGCRRRFSPRGIIYVSMFDISSISDITWEEGSGLLKRRLKEVEIGYYSPYIFVVYSCHQPTTTNTNTLSLRTQDHKVTPPLQIKECTLSNI